jgi:enediyne biosynthesis protein E7
MCPSEILIPAMASADKKIPPGPGERFSPTENLLEWMGVQFREFGDIFKASVYGTDVYVTRDPVHADHVLLKNWQNYVKGQAIKRVAFLLGNGLMVSEGELWKSQRRMIQPAFRREAIAGLIGVITSANSALLGKWEQAAKRRENVDVTSDVSNMVMQLVLAAIFGDDYEQVALDFSVLSEEPARDLEFIEKFRSLGRVVTEIATQRRRQGLISRDFLGILMEARARDSGLPMPDRQLVNEVMTLIVAGHETTASTLNWTWYLLSKHDDVEQKLTNELSGVEESEFSDINYLARFPYTRHVIDEALRLYPAGWLLTRKALSDDHLGDYFVPSRTEIYIPIYFIQRHPVLWTDPDRFNPDRYTTVDSPLRHSLAMVPFSAGPRNCIGELFARVEMQIHLMMIAKRLRLRCVDTRVPELDLGVNLRSKHAFLMSPTFRA